NPRDRASETHRLKLSLSDSLASARDAFAASVLFFCANTTVDVATLTTSAVAATARIGRIAFLPLKTLSKRNFGVTDRRVPLREWTLHLPKRRSGMYVGLDQMLP